MGLVDGITKDQLIGDVYKAIENTYMEMVEDVLICLKEEDGDVD